MLTERHISPSTGLGKLRAKRQWLKMPESMISVIRPQPIMVKAGFSLEFVGRVAGHTTPSTTHRYTHLSVDVTKEALEAIGRRR